SSPAPLRSVSLRSSALRSTAVERVDDPDDDRSDRHLIADPQDLPDAVALAHHDHAVAGSGLDLVDREEAGAGVGAVLVERLHQQERAAAVRRVLDGGDHVAEHAAVPHDARSGAWTSSTIPTIVASTGTNQGSSASAASREPTRYTRSPGPAC